MSKSDFMDLDNVMDDTDGPDKDDVNLDDEDVDLEELMADLKGEGSDDDDDKDDSNEGDSEDEGPDDIDDIVNQRVTEELNRIIPQRLARDRKTQLVQELEQLTGDSLEQIRDKVIQNMVEDTADSMGISEEEARKIVQDRIENAGHKAEKTAEKQQKEEMGAAMQQLQYRQDKTDWMRKPKHARVLTKDFVAKIDEFTQGGKILSFEDGYAFMLGKLKISGEGFAKEAAGAEKKALKTMQERKATPQTKKSGGGKYEGTLSRDQRLIAASLGLTSKEDLAAYAAEVNKENNRKQRRGR